MTVVFGSFKCAISAWRCSLSSSCVSSPLDRILSRTESSSEMRCVRRYPHHWTLRYPLTQCMQRWTLTLDWPKFLNSGA